LEYFKSLLISLRLSFVVFCVFKTQQSSPEVWGTEGFLSVKCYLYLCDSDCWI
jgi:hypothetical protein